MAAYLYNQNTGNRAAEEISSNLSTNLMIGQLTEAAKKLTSEEISNIPGLESAILKDFGTLERNGSDFYLFESDAFDFGNWHWLPGLNPYLMSFVVQSPSGTVYYAGHPSSVKNQTSQDITFIIKQGVTPETNPFIGLIPWATGLPYKDLKPALAFALIYWRDIEPLEGQFDFNKFEESIHLDYCRKNGIKLVLRVIMDYPSDQKVSQLPQWLYDDIQGDGTWYQSASDRYGFSPDYGNPDLIAAHQNLIAKLGERYNRDPAVAFIQLGSLGHYGEWHVSSQVGDMPEPETVSGYIEHYRKAFPDKVLLFRRPVNQMNEKSDGLFNDMIGDQSQTDRWLNWIYSDEDPADDMKSVPEFWKYGPSGGEFAFGDPYRYLKNDVMAETLRQIEASHTSMIGPATPTQLTDPEVRSNANELLAKMGYHFQILSATFPRFSKPGSEIQLRQSWLNTGNSPIYYSWPVRVQLLNSAGQVVFSEILEDDIRTWLPGEIKVESKVKLPDDLSPGLYDWTVGILDPVEKIPAISLANLDRTEDGSYYLGKLLITNE